MEAAEDDDDLKLVQASASLLADLQTALPKILWRPSKDNSPYSKAHSYVKRQDLEYVVTLIEPFQGEPQLLDTKLKHILTPIVDAYLQHIQVEPAQTSGDLVPFENATCILLYTICKVRGYKVVLRFLNNEPRYLEPILSRLEATLNESGNEKPDWHVSYILLLWLSHLLLTPFDLASLSKPNGEEDPLVGALKLQRLPSIAERVLLVGLTCLPFSTKAQDAAALLLVRLVTRPDMQKLSVADALVARALQSLECGPSEVPVPIYERLGPLRFLAGVCTAPELAKLIPIIYLTCQKLGEDEHSPVLANAVAKKLLVKIFRNIAILSLRPLPSHNQLQQFKETTSILEDVIDYSLRSLGDRDTPVRYAAAKALSLIILQLEPEMGYEVIQAVIDSFREDLPQHNKVLDFRDANPLKWHGLTLALAHTLFKRSASPDQLTDIVRVLTAALQFEQRTATGSTVGTNVRDAANFGIWSLSRRYTTQELHSVSVLGLPGLDSVQDTQAASLYLSSHGSHSVIQYLAIQLTLSACLDPAGNIRRGSSAALQELTGRHPNAVYEGIALVQIVDYQAVGLRKRAMVEVGPSAAQLHITYWTILVEAIFGWRGLRSSDVTSRGAAAISIARLSSNMSGGRVVLQQISMKLQQADENDPENLHGLALALACICEEANVLTSNHLGAFSGNERPPFKVSETCTILDKLLDATGDFSLRLLRSELPSATVRFLAALYVFILARCTTELIIPWNVVNDRVEKLTERVLARHEDSILDVIPSLAIPLLRYRKRQRPMIPLGCLEAENLCDRVKLDSAKTTLHGAGRAIALGAVLAWYADGGPREKSAIAANTLRDLTSASSMEWRIIGVRALQLAVKPAQITGTLKLPGILQAIVDATHRAMNDYTIDERGDVGSLVRLRAIACTSTLIVQAYPECQIEHIEVLTADILRLSLEKLDRVRLAAAQCQYEQLALEINPTDLASVSSQAYFEINLQPLASIEPTWKHRALLEGAISCAGISAEPLLQASRAALLNVLNKSTVPHLQGILSTFANILKSMLTEDTNNMHAALELLAFLLDMQIPQRLIGVDFKWRNLLSTVQKSHHKSNDIPKILVAVQVYRGLADIAVIRPEVMKKLISMLKTNPYPRVRLSVAEVLFVITQEPELLERGWLKPTSQHLRTIQTLEKKYLREL